MADRTLLIAMTFAFIASPSIRAEELPPAPTIILPNYDRTLVGNIPSLEAGAYGARVNDASSNWYNPAGLLHSKKTSVNASASAYQWTGVKAQAGESYTGSVTGAQPPSFFGVVIGSPVTSSDDLRFGFSITNETYWAPSIQSQIPVSTPPGQEKRVLYSARDNFTETIPAIALAFTAAPDLRIGFAVAGDIVSFQANDTATTQITDASSQSYYSRSSQINASSLNLQGSVGAQYDLTDEWKLSGVIKTRSLRLFGSSRTTIENTSSASGTFTDTAFFDPNAEFKYQRPWQAGFGVAYVTQPFEIEADLRYHAALGPYTAFSSTSSITTTSNSGGAPTTSEAPLNDVDNQFRSITNFAIGAKYALSESVDLHGGFFTAYSPLASNDSSIFRKLDLKGVTFGASLRIERFSGSLGAAYEWGTSDPFTVPTSSGGNASTTIKVTSLSVLYALSFSF